MSQAVGPVPLLVGELNPLPVASAIAILPVSCWNGTEASASAGIARDSWYAYATRHASATATISHSDAVAAMILRVSNFTLAGLDVDV